MPIYHHTVTYIAHYPDSSPEIRDVYQLPISSKLGKREIEEIILERERAENREVFDIELINYDVQPTR